MNPDSGSDPQEGPLYWIPLIAAFLVGIGISLFGLFAGAWGGFFPGTNIVDQILGLLFWGLPALSFPCVLLFLMARRVGLACAGIIPIGTFVTLVVINVRQCNAGSCTTTNPVSMIFGTLFRMPLMWVILALAPALLYLASKNRRDPA